MTDAEIPLALANFAFTGDVVPGTPCRRACRIPEGDQVDLAIAFAVAFARGEARIGNRTISMTGERYAMLGTSDPSRAQLWLLKDWQWRMIGRAHEWALGSLQGRISANQVVEHVASCPPGLLVWLCTDRKRWRQDPPRDPRKIADKAADWQLPRAEARKRVAELVADQPNAPT